MNAGRLVAWLTALNLVLLAVVGWLWYRQQATPMPDPRYVPLTKTVTNTVRRTAFKVLTPGPITLPPAQLAWRWGDVESVDYLVYQSNLRTIGCPEETIQDILLTDIARLYRERRAEILKLAPPVPFWQTDLRSARQPERWRTAYDPATQKLLDELKGERDHLVRELFHLDFEQALARYQDRGDAARVVVDFLPFERRVPVLELAERHAAELAKLDEQSHGLMLPEVEARRRKLEKEFGEELGRHLTPEEQREYELRNSPLADDLRRELAGVNATETEFRKIHAARQALERLEPADTQTRQQAQAEAWRELALSLGPERFAEHQRLKDQDYKTLLQIAEQHSLTRATAGQVLEIKKVAEAEIARLEALSKLSVRQRQQALGQAEAASRQAVLAVLGEQAYQTYLQNAAGWLSQFEAAAENLIEMPPMPVSPPFWRNLGPHEEPVFPTDYSNLPPGAIPPAFPAR